MMYIFLSKKIVMTIRVILRVLIKKSYKSKFSYKSVSLIM